MQASLNASPPRSCSRWSRRWSRSWHRSSSSSARSPLPYASTPTARSSARLPKRPGSVITAAIIVAEIGDCRARYPYRGEPPATPARPASPLGQASARSRAFRWASDDACATRLHARRQHPPLAPVGRRPLRSRDRARTRPPARHPHPRPRLVPHPVALLAAELRMTRHRHRGLQQRPGDDPWIVGPRPDLSRHQRFSPKASPEEADRRAERRRA